MTSAVLEVAEVGKRLGGRQVLASVSFSAWPGEIVGIVGENGSGKSTLLRILAGLLRPSSGTVRLGGRLGYCDQEPQVCFELTVAEHFAYFARAYGLADGAWQATRDELLERLDFARYSGFRVSALSGGTRQKLHLSLALLHRPQVIVLDEPYAAFDWATYLRFWQYSESLRREGAAIVLVSHLAYERSRFGRILELARGRLQ